MKHQRRNSKKGKLLRSLLIFLIGVILILVGISRNQNSGVSYSKEHFHYYMNDGVEVLFVGIAFIIGAIVQFKNLGKKENIKDRNAKKRKSYSYFPYK